ncbi:MAG TPA: insulinase family protein, partial [Bacteroidia bacterium]|nr:insulinase family protein [Bacteroidia bacterium]
RAGSKNDPHDATGLAHYLEHMLFKGTDKFGSKDYVKEKVELDKIENLFEVYRKTTDEGKRKDLYHQIDSISGVASGYAIANEYDKMTASIGAKATNAHTSFEQTVYENDIPSNQLDNWLTIEAERFRNPVLRLFHTELEAVYEEKNRGLDADDWKVLETLFLDLFPNNTYGSQTTIGTIDHLKNPSLTEIKKYYDNYYVPNNMAICLSGDFDPDATIKLIDEKFKAWKSKPVGVYQPYIEKTITSPIISNVVGPQAENLMIGYRFGGASTADADMVYMIDQILSNGKAGLIDLNLNQQQKVLSAGTYAEGLKDYTVHMLVGEPKAGQSLEQVKDLLLEQIEKIKKGDFPEWLLPAIINNLKLQETKQFESNANRANAFVDAFIKGTDWQKYVSEIDRISKITKQQLVDFAKKNYTNNYAVVYKRIGEDKNIQKVTKPVITPVQVNRNDQSPFLKSIISKTVADIQPVFIDYNKDIKKFNIKNNIQVLFTPNIENKTFAMFYAFDMGSNQNKKLEVAINYLKYLGTKELTAAQVQEEFFKLGCSYSVSAEEDKVLISVAGLTENIEKATQLLENLLANAQPNDDALKGLVGDIQKKRADAKLDKGEILEGALLNYAKYGKNSPYTNRLSDRELENLTSAELISILNGLTSYEHHILYYGNNTQQELTAMLDKVHKTPASLKPVPPRVKFQEREANTDVYVVDYDMKQAEIILLSKDDLCNLETRPTVRLFNEYFGAGMSSIVFQDMRESKALAYSVYCGYSNAGRKDDYNYIFSYIGTQADKLPEAMAGMMDLINNFPEAPDNFKAAQESVLQGIRSERIIKTGILFNYESAKRLGFDHDVRKDIYDKINTMTLADIKAFEQKHLKEKQYMVLVIGKKDTLDLKTLEKYGKVSFVTLEEIFGY